MQFRGTHNADHYFQSFRAGEESGFTYFFTTYYKALCFFAHRYVKDQSIAEEIAEDGFIAIWAKRHLLETESGLRSYLYKTVYHGCLRWIEREKREERHRKAYASLIGDYEKDFSETVFRTETLRLLREAIGHLPGQCRKIFFKLYIEGKTTSETAAEMQLTISTINNQRARGIKLLKRGEVPYLLLVEAGELLV